MSFDFVNQWMLAGLAGISLPVIVHLLNRRRFDVVDWGAMQFLEMSQKTRRRVRLEELLLLLLRILIVALLALALSRPSVSGTFLSRYASTQARDVVFVIDGSYSMGWEGGDETPHAAAIKWAHELLETLRPGDTVSIIDARDVPRAVLDPPAQDFDAVRTVLDELPAPSGGSDLAAAAARGVQILSRTSNPAREVVVLTDRQKLPWRSGDGALWRRFDDLLTQPAVRPRVWVVDVSPDETDKPNFAVGNLSLSRDLSVPNYPIRIETVLKSYSKKQASRRVYVEINGQRVAEKTRTVTVPPGGEAPVDFEVRRPTTGSWLISVLIDADDLPGDDRADAAVTTAAAVPVLVVDGSWSADPTRRDSFFVQAALSSSENKEPWVRALAIPGSGLQSADLNEVAVLVLANVDRISPAVMATIRDFVFRGGGLFVAVGDRADESFYNEDFYADGRSLLPARLVRIEEDRAGELDGVRVTDTSLDLPWMQRFRTENDGGFTEARYSRWWRLTPAPAAETQSVDGEDVVTVSDPIVAARLNTGDPLLVTRRFGKGRVALMAAPLDADWGNLPTRHDFVPFLHEITFHLASAEVARNVGVGAPLVQPIAAGTNSAAFEFLGPSDTRFVAEAGGDELKPALQLSDTRLAGVYQLVDKTGASPPRYFVVSGDRAESDLTPLDDSAVDVLQGDQRMAFVKDLSELQQKMFAEESPTELWPALLVVFLLLLIGELVLTRRLVRGGHVHENTVPPNELGVPDHPQEAEADDVVELEVVES